MKKAMRSKFARAEEIGMARIEPGTGPMRRTGLFRREVEIPASSSRAIARISGAWKAEPAAPKADQPDLQHQFARRGGAVEARFTRLCASCVEAGTSFRLIKSIRSAVAA